MEKKNLLIVGCLTGIIIALFSIGITIYPVHSMLIIQYPPEIYTI